jgi:hypothetical protein
MDNTLKARVNQELLSFYKGKPDLIREALTLYIRSQQKFIEIYQKETD